jgi:hypothetical protein
MRALTVTIIKKNPGSNWVAAGAKGIRIGLNNESIQQRASNATQQPRRPASWAWSRA